MESLTEKEKILEKFVDAITDKVKHLKNLDTINGLIGAIPILEEILDIHEECQDYNLWEEATKEKPHVKVGKETYYY